MQLVDLQISCECTRSIEIYELLLLFSIYYISMIVQIEEAKPQTMWTQMMKSILLTAEHTIVFKDRPQQYITLNEIRTLCQQ